MICLSPEEISDYLRGALPDEDSDLVEEHLMSCDRCDAEARQLDASGDSLLRDLKVAAQTGESEREASDSETREEMWRSCLDQLRELPRQIDGADSPPDGVSLQEHLRPERVYHYELGRELGRGGMGVVYQSWHPQLHRPVAIKLLSASRSSDDSSVARFRREMRAAGGLDHPGIVRAVDAGIWQGTYYLVMEWIDGIDLSRLAKRTRVPVAEACAIIARAAEALQQAHDHQVIHRDLKPSNLMLTREGQVKILDFGLARLGQEERHGLDATTAGRLVGTLDYLAPEQAAGDRPIDARTDVYGLGATLFRLLSGRPPHGFSQDMPILPYLQSLIGEEADKITDYRDGLPPELVRLVEELLDRDPLRRPATAGEVANRLQEFALGADLERLANSCIDRQASDRTAVDSTERDELQGGNPKEGSGQNRESRSPATPAMVSPQRPTTVRTLLVALGSCFLGVIFGWHGVTLWLQAGDATVKVHSTVDDVTLEFVRDGEVARSVQVHPGDEVSRVRVGKYELRIAGKSDHVRIDQNSLWLMRGDERIVRITEVPSAEPKAVAAVDPPTADPDAIRLGELQRRLLDTRLELQRLRETFGADHPRLLAAEKEQELLKRELMALVTGEDPDAQMSKGRTYRQWTDIVARETDAGTLVDAVNSIASLTGKDEWEETVRSLTTVARWNESQSSRPPGDDYISYKTVRKRVSPDPRRRPTGEPEYEQDYPWEQIYPPVDETWRSLTSAIVSAMATLPVEALADTENSAWPDQLAAAESPSLKRILLLDAVKNRRKEDAEYAETLVRRFRESDLPEQVRSLAEHLALAHFEMPVGDLQRETLIQGPPAVRQAILATLLKEKSYPAGKEMGIACGELMGESEYGWAPRVHDLAKRSLHEGDKFRESQEMRLLQAAGAGLVSYWSQGDPKLSGRLSGIDVVGMLAAAGLMKEETRTEASRFLHDYLRRQLETRAKLEHPEHFDESSMWTLYVVQTLVSLDGKLPEELYEFAPADGSKQKQALDKWATSFLAEETDSDRAFSLWQVQFPLEVTELALSEAQSRFDERANSQTPTIRPGFRGSTIRWSADVRFLEQMSLGVAIAVVAQGDRGVASAVGALCEMRARSSVDEVRLSVPLNAFSETLFKLAQDDSALAMRGDLLMFSQMGGIDEAKLRAFIFERLAEKQEADGKPSTWAATPHELAGLLQCLMAMDQPSLTQQELDLISEHVKGASFSPSARTISDLEHCMLAAVSLGNEMAKPDPEILKASLGLTSQDFRPRWSSMRSSRRTSSDYQEMLWSRASSSVPIKVFRAALEVVKADPPNDEAMMKTLKSRLRMLSSMGEAEGEVSTALNAAIDAIRKQVEASESGGGDPAESGAGDPAGGEEGDPAESEEGRPTESR